MYTYLIILIQKTLQALCEVTSISMPRGCYISVPWMGASSLYPLPWTCTLSKPPRTGGLVRQLITCRYELTFKICLHSVPYCRWCYARPSPELDVWCLFRQLLKWCAITPCNCVRGTYFVKSGLFPFSPIALLKPAIVSRACRLITQTDMPSLPGPNSSHRTSASCTSTADRLHAHLLHLRKQSTWHNPYTMLAGIRLTSHASWGSAHPLRNSRHSLTNAIYGSRISRLTQVTMASFPHYEWLKANYWYW